MTKKVSLAGRKRTKDLQSSTEKMDLTKQALLEMQEKEGLTSVPESVLGTAEVQPSLALGDDSSGSNKSEQSELSRVSQNAVNSSVGARARTSCSRVSPQAPNRDPVKAKPAEQDPRLSEDGTKITTKSKASSSPAQFEADAVKYLLSVYKKLSGSSDNRYDFSPYQKHKKMVHYFKKVVNARAEVHASEDMPFEQNQALCQRFVENITERLNASGIELRPLVVVPE